MKDRAKVEIEKAATDNIIALCRHNFTHKDEKHYLTFPTKV